MTEKNVPLISVVIPAFNAEKYIEETLESALDQTYTNIEVIVINDGSSDRTQEIINKFKSRVKSIETKNKGVSHARNLGITAAKGEWIAFLDADDIWLRDKLNAQFSSMGQSKWSHCDSFYIGEGQSGAAKRSDYSLIPTDGIFDALIVENFITTSSVLIDKRLLLTFGAFDEGLACLEDWKLWLAIAKEHPLTYCSQALVKYRVYSGSTSRKVRTVLPLHIELIDRTFIDLADTSANRVLKRKAKCKSYSICSYIAEDACDFSFAWQTAFRAFLLEPISAKNIRRIVACSLNWIKVYKSNGFTNAEK